MLSFTSSVLSSHGACTFRTILHQWPLNIIYDILSPNKLYSPNCWYDSLTYEKNISLTDDLYSLFHRKMYNPLPFQCSPCPIWPPVHPQSLAYTSLTPSLVCNCLLIKKVFHAQFVGMFMIDLHIKWHMSSSNGSLVTMLNWNLIRNFSYPPCCSTFY
jgi:hypothetical protein